MKIVASITDPSQASAAAAAGADMIELRLDLTDVPPRTAIEECRKRSTLPLIATLRSLHEGGNYSGSSEEWLGRVLPVAPLVAYVDVEQRYSAHAPVIHAEGPAIIASYHTKEMPPLFALFGLERELRAYGQIPKIVVSPGSEEDVIELISFTRAAQKPVCTSIVGTKFRYARLMLPMFGSEFAYCSVGTPTAEGQYTVGEFRALSKQLGK